MPLFYSLYENPLKKDGSQRAMVKVHNTFREEDIVQEMLDRGSTLTRADLLAVLELQKQVLADIIEDGGAIETDWLKLRPTLRGNFESMQNRFDKKKHK